MLCVEVTSKLLELRWPQSSAMVTEDPDSFEDMLSQVRKIARDVGLSDGDRYIISAGVPFGVPGTTNTLKIDTL